MSAPDSLFTVVHNDEGDWVGIYGPDGRLVREGHSLSESETLETVGVAHNLVWNVVIPPDEGSLPKTLGELAALGGFTREVRP